MGKKRRIISSTKFNAKHSTHPANVDPTPTLETTTSMTITDEVKKLKQQTVDSLNTPKSTTAAANTTTTTTGAPKVTTTEAAKNTTKKTTKATIKKTKSTKTKTSQ